MSATMAVTPVLADTFTDDSQSIISGNAEIPAVDVESDTNCGDTMGDSDCIEKELTEFQDPLFMEEDYGDAESARFSSGNDAEVVSDFYDDSVPAAQTEEKRLFTWIRHGETIIILERVIRLLYKLFRKH